MVMYREVSWAVPADPYILEELANYNGWHTPKSLSLNTEFSRQWISQRCKKYTEFDLAERHPESPAYRITDRGRTTVNGDLDLEELTE